MNIKEEYVALDRSVLVVWIACVQTQIKTQAKHIGFDPDCTSKYVSGTKDVIIRARKSPFKV